MSQSAELDIVSRAPLDQRLTIYEHTAPEPVAVEPEQPNLKDEPITIREAIRLLAHEMSVEAAAKAKIDEIVAEYAPAIEPYVLAKDEASHEIKGLRAYIDGQMTAMGVRTIDGDGGWQCQRQRTARLEVVDRDKVIAHLTAIGRLEEVQIVTIDEERVKRMAELIDGGIEGVETVEKFVFKVIAPKKK